VSGREITDEGRREPNVVAFARFFDLEYVGAEIGKKKSCVAAGQEPG
jgi:hypothetical protein